MRFFIKNMKNKGIEFAVLREIHNAKCFIKDIKEYGIIYAALLKFWQFLDDLNFKSELNIKVTRIQNKVEIILDKYDNHMEPQEPLEFESNCINHWSCDCCPSKSLCNEF